MKVFRGVPKGRMWTLAERKARGAVFCGSGLTEQAHKDACDINRIMAQYSKTGLVPVMASQVPKYGDFSAVSSYQDALNLIIDAQDAFDQLPAQIRKEFDHDPGLFLQALEDPQKRQRLIELGVFVDPDAKAGSDKGGSEPPEGGSEP